MGLQAYRVKKGLPLLVSLSFFRTIPEEMIPNAAPGIASDPVI